MTQSNMQLATYEAIGRLSTQMLAAAQRSEWQRLTVLELDCRRLVEQLRSAPSDAPLQPAERARKVEILRRVLAEDAAIRDLVEPWMAELQALIGTTGRRRDLHRTYGAGST